MTETPDDKFSGVADTASRPGESVLARFRRIGLMFLGAAVLILVFVGIPIWFSEWDETPDEKKGCYQVQEIKGEWYKVDTCTGKTEKLIGPDEQTKKRPETKKR